MIRIATIAKTEFVLVANPNVQARSFKELVTLARSKPGQLTYGSAGNASGVHLATEQFLQVTGLQMLHVPYKGSGAMITDLMGGQIDFAFQTPAVALPHISSQRLRAFAVTGGERIASLPDVPTLAELGVANLDVANWFGLLAPAGTPREVLTRLESAADAALSQPDMLERMAKQGLVPFRRNAEQFAALMRAESERTAKLAQSVKITMD